MQQKPKKSIFNRLVRRQEFKIISIRPEILFCPWRRNPWHQVQNRSAYWTLTTTRHNMYPKYYLHCPDELPLSPNRSENKDDHSRKNSMSISRFLFSAFLFFRTRSRTVNRGYFERWGNFERPSSSGAWRPAGTGFCLPVERSFLNWEAKSRPCRPSCAAAGRAFKVAPPFKVAPVYGNTPYSRTSIHRHTHTD